MSDDRQFTIEDLQKEIEKELGLPEGFGYEPPQSPDYQKSQNGTEEDRVSRKPFRINDFDCPRDREMAVFTHAKKLSEYVFVVTEKSPKKFRWSITTRLQNASVDIVENLYRANFERDEDVRLQYQKNAGVALSILDFYTETARTKQAINIRQMSIIARQIAETRKLLNGWEKATKRKPK